MHKLMVGICVIVAATISLCVGLANIHLLSPPRLTIKFDGKPAANTMLLLPLSSIEPHQLDEAGCITSPNPESACAILVPRPTGGAVSVRFPEHGMKTVDIRDQMMTITFVKYFGLVSNQVEQFALTQQQVAEIESGQRTLSDVQNHTRRSN